MKYLNCLGICLCLTFCGCTPELINVDTNIANKYEIEYSDIRVKDFAIEKDVKVGDVVWVNGFIPIHKGYNPQIHEVFYKKLSQGLKNSKNGGRIDIAIIDSGLFMEKDFADDMAFVNLFAMAREREFMCTATLNIEDSTSSKRVTFENKIKRGYFNDKEEMSSFVSNCNDKLVEKTYEYIKSNIK